MLYNLFIQYHWALATNPIAVLTVTCSFWFLMGVLAGRASK